MADRDHVARLQASSADHNGCVTWNQWRLANPLVSIDLRQADLSEADLTMANLREADLRHAELQGADLADSDLREALLNGAMLREANLRRADLREADLQEADLTRAYVGWTAFAMQNLQQVIGLATVEHMGPSSIATDAFSQSDGALPAAFLRGCGVPDDLIDFTRTSMSVKRFIRAFLCYHHEDATLATRLAEDLQAQQLGCWHYPDTLKIGADSLRHIDQAIRFQGKLVVICSVAALASPQIAHTVEQALAQEMTERRQILFPLTLDAAIHDAAQPWVTMLRQTRAIGDFADWSNQEQYHIAFTNLLGELQAE